MAVPSVQTLIGSALHGYDGDWDHWDPNATTLATQYNKKFLVEEWSVVASARTNDLAWNLEKFVELGLSWFYWELVLVRIVAMLFSPS